MKGPLWYLIIVVLLSLAFWSRPSHDPDLGWHLAGGKWMMDHLNSQVQGVEQLSDRFLPDYDFINTFRDSWHDYHWLGQLLFYRVYIFGGYQFLHLFLCFIIFCLLMVLVSSIRKQVSREAVVPLILIPSAILLYDISSVRPQMIALLGIAAAHYLLLQKGTRSVFALFLIAVILANIHVYWVFIPLLWFLYCCIPRGMGNYEITPLQCWGGLFLLSGAALLSPYGLFQSHLTLQTVLSNYALLWDYLYMPDYLRRVISELKSPLSGVGLVSELFLFSLLFLGRYIRKSDFQKHPGMILAALIGAILTFRAVKFLGVFVIFAAPYFAKLVDRVCAESNYQKNLAKVSSVVLFAGLLWVGYVLVPAMREPDRVQTMINRSLPIKACSTIADYKPPVSAGRKHSRLLTHFNYGGWCRWVIFQKNPQLNIQVTTDGRTQGFGSEIFKKSFDLYNLKEGWQQTLQEWNPDMILAAREHSLSHFLFLPISGWQNIYRDNDFAVFVKATQ